MNADIEQLVREGLDRLTADLRVPVGMAARARAREQRRKIAVSTALACGTAAVVIAVVALSAWRGGGAAGARATAYVVTRVDRALTAEQFVIQGQATGSVTVSVRGHQVRSSDGPTISWVYGKQQQTTQFTPGGQRYLAEGTALIGGKLTGAYITYYNRKYSLFPLNRPPVTACSTTAQLELGGPAVTVPNWPVFIHAMLHCGAATRIRQAQIGAEQATVISGTINVPLQKGYARAVQENRALVRYALYVDSATYLPVRVYGSTETYGGPHGPTVSSYTTNVRWLPPTKANIANTLVTVSPGYQRVNSAANQ